MLDYVELREDLAPQCAAIELPAFQHADRADLLSEKDFLVYARTFPEGFFVCLDGATVLLLLTCKGGEAVLDDFLARVQLERMLEGLTSRVGVP